MFLGSLCKLFQTVLDLSNYLIEDIRISKGIYFKIRAKVSKFICAISKTAEVSMDFGGVFIIFIYFGGFMCALHRP